MSASARVYARPDGSIVTIVTPAPGWTLDDACAVTVAKRPELDGRPWLDVDRTTLPTTRRFRNCWRKTDAGIAVDLPLARAQRLAEIRRDRDRRFEPFDREWMKAQGRGETAAAAAIEGKRQQLRDVPQAAMTALAACATADAVAAYEPTWPEVSL